MYKLISTAWRNKVYRTLVFIIVFSMIAQTIASQLEIFTLGFMTKKGTDAFVLFAPEVDGKLQQKEYITIDERDARWKEITGSTDSTMTQQEANSFIAQKRDFSIFEVYATLLDTHLNLTGNPVRLALLIIFVAVFKAISLFIHRYSTRFGAISISADLRQRYFEHIQSLPMEFYQRYNIATLSSRVVSDAATIAEAINSCMVNYLQTPFTIVSTLALCFATSWQLSLIIFFGFPLIVYPIIYLAQRVRRISKQLLSNQERFATVLLDYLAGIQTVKVFAMEDFSMRKYRDQNDQMMALERKSARYDLSSRPIIHTIAMFFLATALLYGLYILNMSVSEALVYCGLLYVFYEPIKKFAEENSHIQRGLAAADRMFEVLEQQPLIRDSEGAHTIKSFEKEIEFKNVWFRYGENDWVLKNLNFTIRKGEMVALVGATGAGKSTIAQLLPRLYDVTQGEILLDGQPLNYYQQKSLRELMGFVPQKPFLFLDTVAANISFGRPYTDEEVREAARKAHATDFIEHLPKGYNTMLTDAGSNLSGGQQQRLAIARALIKKAPILILDEATSSLDSISEKHIKMALHELHGEITQIVIAHRLSTIEDADKIIFLEHGIILDIGTRMELLERCPQFRTMWETVQKPAKQPKEVPSNA
ncbi:MAG: ABC transporter ATP-binding protein [Parachlamydiales bacterium]|jgi:putative ABC transport system ATP-binding protein